jgi:hypothetical protein
VRVFCALVCAFIGSAAHADGPGRCDPFDGSYTIAAGEFAPTVAPYTRCLASADKRYGFNDGPYAIGQCKSERAEAIDAVALGQRENIEFLLAEVEREQVWLVWCSTDVGSKLPSHIEVRPEWPQGGAKGRPND